MKNEEQKKKTLKTQLENMLNTLENCRKKTENMLNKTWHDSGPPQQFHWARIILGKLDTIVDPHTNRRTTLITYDTSYNYSILIYANSNVTVWPLWYL